MIGQTIGNDRADDRADDGFPSFYPNFRLCFAVPDFIFLPAKLLGAGVAGALSVFFIYKKADGLGGGALENE